MTNYKSYEIDLSNVWEYERSQFLKGKSTEYHAKKVLDKIHPLIAQFSTKLKDTGSLSTHYNIKYVEASIRGLKGKYKTDIFRFESNYYRYNNNILINREVEDFEFWFSLKLRQYVKATDYINSFLDFQLLDNFDEQAEQFCCFLKLNILKYKDEFYTEEIINVINNWVTINTIKKDITELADSYSESKNNSTKTKVLNNKKERKMEGEIHSLLLKELDVNSKYFQENINEFTGILVKLKKEQFIHNSTNLDSFKAIFQNKKIKSEKRIIWIGTVKELQWFIKYVAYESKKVVDLKNDIWLVTSKCFMNKEQQEFTDIQLRKASGNKLKRKELLASILSQL